MCKPRWALRRVYACSGVKVACVLILRVFDSEECILCWVKGCLTVLGPEGCVLTLRVVGACWSEGVCVRVSGLRHRMLVFGF